MGDGLGRWAIRWCSLGLCLIALLGTFGLVRAQTAEGDIIREIIVEGAQRIEPNTVRSYLLVRAGDAFDATRIDRSLKSLFATGLFADVAILRQGDALVVKVSENPIINRIAFEGNQRIDDETLESEITLRPRTIYTRTKVQSDVSRILTIYRRSGRFSATVDPKVIQLPQNRVDIAFEIHEGPVTEVERISFVGNEAFSDSRLLEVIRTRQSRWWRFFTADDTYDPDRLALDRELLRRFYLSEGYADFRVQSAVAELTPDQQDFFITFTVEEGERYTFGEIKAETTLPGLDVEALQDTFDIEQGDWYDANKVEQTIELIEDAVGDLGYAFVEVRPRITRNREDLEINITFEIDEGPRVYVERIDIRGNVRTKDEVIRREFRLIEGDAFNAARLQRSRQRIQNLDFFERVEVEEVPGSTPDRAIIKVDVKEKSTGSLSLGAGFSSGGGLLADINLRERNLLGRGQDLRVGLAIGTRQQQVDLSFTEPYFLDRDVAAGFDIFHVETDRQDESSFDSVVTGMNLRANYPITEHLRQGWRYSLKRVEIKDVPDDASPVIQESKGVDTISEVSHTISYDRRDNAINPTAGYFADFTTDAAGLGGSVTYLRNRIDGGYYYSVSDQWILSFLASGGHISGLGEDTRVGDRFFIGGDNIRGFETDGIGPRDTDTDDALGAELFYAGSIQLAFPLGLPTEFEIRGRVFTDFGSAWSLPNSGPDIADSSNIRASVGTGITWVSPFGPIGIDLGVPITKEDFDRTEIVRVNFGTRF